VQSFHTPPVGFLTSVGFTGNLYHLCNPGISTICGTRSLCHCGTPCGTPCGIPSYPLYLCVQSFIHHGPGTTVYRIYRASLLELPWRKVHAPSPLHFCRFRYSDYEKSDRPALRAVTSQLPRPIPALIRTHNLLAFVAWLSSTWHTQRGGMSSLLKSEPTSCSTS
jgi:hypothetical protein